jgi:glutaredoxin 3|tara:strand:- start:75 stop:344 length:270 start_codon:yes stop_codon:yes gene_type:complete
LANIEIYTSPFCGFCYRAKLLLNDKGVDYIEVDIISQPKRHSEMISRAGGLQTVPQIFIDNQHIGGCDELYELEAKDKLDSILGVKETR